MKNIFKCTKCKGKKVRTRTQGMICTKCEIPVLLKEDVNHTYEKAKKIAKSMPKITSSATTMTVSDDSWNIIRPKKVNKKK